MDKGVFNHWDHIISHKIKGFGTENLITKIDDIFYNQTSMKIKRFFFKRVLIKIKSDKTHKETHIRAKMGHIILGSWE